MPNKTVENPCSGSGMPYKGEPWEMKHTTGSGTKKVALCSVCEDAVTINKKTLVARKHWEPSEGDVVDVTIIRENNGSTADNLVAEEQNGLQDDVDADAVSIGGNS